jgi:endonuclease G, mitochondrial
LKIALGEKAKGLFWAALWIALMGCNDTEVGADLHIPHCIIQCPSNSDYSNKIIIRNNYTLSSNRETKFADWVAYKVSLDSIGSGCSRKWKRDPDLSEDETLEPSDYYKAHDSLSVDRGHLVPLASFCATETWEETNYLSNITPQKSSLNRGAWKNLEGKVRQVANEGIDVFVLAGPLFEHPMPPLPKADESHMVPSGYWKVISFRGDGDRVTSYPFLFQQETKRGADYCDHLTELSEVEAVSGLRLYLPKSTENIRVGMGIC